MKNAVVFGATGQLGCYSAIALKEDGYNVYAVGRRNSDNGFFETKCSCKYGWNYASSR